MNLQPLNLPRSGAAIRRRGETVEVYDRLRRKYVVLTPEEWVRQCFVDYMVDTLGYPAGLMGNEVSLTLNGTRRRCDTVVFDRNGHPWMIVEYKAPAINITRAVFEQIARYNMVLGASYLVVSNGLRHYCVRYDGPGRYGFEAGIPAHPGLCRE